MRVHNHVRSNHVASIERKLDRFSDCVSSESSTHANGDNDDGCGGGRSVDRMVRILRQPSRYGYELMLKVNADVNVSIYVCVHVVRKER